MTSRIVKVRLDAVRVLAFVLFTALLAAGVVVLLGNYSTQPTHSFHADFTNASGIVSGADVRAAGVKVGRVDGLTLLPDNHVEVTFSLDDDVPLSSATHARIRYADLTGDRYLDLDQSGAAGTALPAGATIPVSSTQPALDLDMLFNGFQPLLTALDPSQVNRLTRSIIAVSQGEGPAISSLLAQVGSFTNTLADHDALIGSVVDNLTTVLGTVEAHRGDVGRLVDGLDRLTSGLASDKVLFGTSLHRIDDLAHETAGLVRQARPAIHGNVVQGLRLIKAVDSNLAPAYKYLRLTPKAIHAVGRAGAYGSFFNFFICGVRVKFTGPTGPTYTPWQYAKDQRCQG